MYFLYAALAIVTNGVATVDGRSTDTMELMKAAFAQAVWRSHGSGESAEVVSKSKSLRVDGPHTASDVAFTAVFRFGKDPQRGKRYHTDDPSLIHGWRKSCERLEMNCVVLHDDAFDAAFQDLFNSKHVEFIERHPVVNHKYVDHGTIGLTSPDMRFIELLKHLESPQGSSLEYVLLTDASDVEFRKDPFKLMRAIDGAMGTHYLFGGEEWRPRVQIFDDSNLTAISRLVPYWKSCFEYDMPEIFLAGRMPNCGILGGHVSIVKPFLQRMRHHYENIAVDRRYLMCDMLVFARTLFEDYNDRMISGYPFHAKFANDDLQEEAAIYHKSAMNETIASTNGNLGKN